MPRPRHSLRAIVVLTALLAGSRRASAEGLALRLEPTYTSVSTISTDPTGARTVTKGQALDQLYRLSLDRSLSPSLQFGASGLFDWQLGERDVNLERTTQDARMWSGGARLTFHDPVLSGGLRYDRRDESLETRTLGQLATGPGRVNEAYAFNARWAPDDAPRLDLFASRTITYDHLRALTDQTVDRASLSAAYSPSRGLDLGYSAAFSRPQDHLKNVVSNELGQIGRVSYGRPFLGDRGQFSAGYLLTHRTVETVASGSGGVVTSQQFPTQGFSAIEPLPAPEQTVLSPNPALIDGGVEASAGLDLGYGRALAGDNKYRDIGAELADPAIAVNRIDVYVDKSLAPEIAAMFGWTAYRSDDNQTWSAVPLSGSVRFEPFANRFEIPIAAGPTRYVKVVTRPLLPSAAADARFEAVFVTEIQLLSVASAAVAESRGRVSALGGMFSEAATFRILRSPDLRYDQSLSLSHADQPSFRYIWSLSNGLSFGRRLSRALMLRSRLDRTDSEAASSHTAMNRLSATLVADPIPTFTTAATVSGQVSQTALGVGRQGAVTLLTRLDPYRGVNVGANGTMTLGRNELGQETRSNLLGASLSLLPHPKATIGASYAFTQSRVRGGGIPERTTGLQSVEGTVSLNPVRALFASLGATRTLAGGPPTTLASVIVGFSPFPDGSLLLRGSYTDTIDTFSELRTRMMGPGLRWNMVRNSYLELSYSRQETFSPVGDTLTRGFLANLVVTPIG